MTKVFLDNDLESVSSSSTQGALSLGVGVGGGVMLKRDGARFVVHLEVGDYAVMGGVEE